MRRALSGWTVCVLVSALAFEGSLAGQNGRGAAPAQGPIEDCLPHNPKTLEIVAMPNAPAKWRLMNGHEAMAVFDNRVDANNALALAQRYTMHCGIGRHRSTRTGGAPAEDYGLKYWKGPSGIESKINPEQCTSYKPAELVIRDKGSDGWILTDKAQLTIKLDNRDDAEAALALARQYSSRCVIGHEVRPTLAVPGSTRYDYWK